MLAGREQVRRGGVLWWCVVVVVLVLVCGGVRRGVGVGPKGKMEEGGVGEGSVECRGVG